MRGASCVSEVNRVGSLVAFELVARPRSGDETLSEKRCGPSWVDEDRRGFVRGRRRPPSIALGVLGNRWNSSFEHGCEVRCVPTNSRALGAPKSKKVVTRGMIKRAVCLRLSTWSEREPPRFQGTAQS